MDMKMNPDDAKKKNIKIYRAKQHKVLVGETILDFNPSIDLSSD